MHAIEVGAEVVRTKGEKYQVGARGVVYEVSGERLRVYWHTNPSPSTKPKRTWVNVSAVEQLQAQHTPEPWRMLDHNLYFAAAGEFVVADFYASTAGTGGLRNPSREVVIENCRRAVACVNACAGVEGGGLRPGVLRETRDALAALVAMNRCNCGRGTEDYREAMEAAEAALAKAKP